MSPFIFNAVAKYLRRMLTSESLPLAGRSPLYSICRFLHCKAGKILEKKESLSFFEKRLLKNDDSYPLPSLVRLWMLRLLDIWILAQLF